MKIRKSLVWIIIISFLMSGVTFTIGSSQDDGLKSSDSYVNSIDINVQTDRTEAAKKYPFSKDYFINIFGTKELIVESMDVQSVVTSGEYLDISVTCVIKESSDDTTRNLTKEDNPTAEITVIDDDNRVVKRITPNLERSEYNAEIETGDLSGGTYTIKFEGTIPDMDSNVTEAVSVVVYGPEKDINVKDFEVSLQSLMVGESVNISASVENKINKSVSFDVSVDRVPINSYEIEPGESIDVEEEYTFDEPGKHVVSISNKTKSVKVYSSGLVVKSIDAPNSAHVGERVAITVDLENDGKTVIEDQVYFDGGAIKDYQFTLQPEDSKSLTIKRTFGSTGTYKVSVGDKTKEMEVFKPFIIKDIDLSDDEVNKGGKVEISAVVVNNNDESRSVDIKVDDELIKSIKIQPGTDTYTYEHKFDEKGTYEISVGDQSAGEVKVKAKEKDTPGYTLNILLLTISIVLFYKYKKKKDHLR